MYAVEDKSNIAVLRPIFNNDSQADNVRSHIRDIAKGHQSRAYDLIGALMSVIKRNHQNRPEKFFCSHLVASIFRDAGFPLFDKKDYLVKPNDFLKCSRLYDVTDSTVLKVPDYIANRTCKDGVEVPMLDKGGDTASPHAKLLRKFISMSKEIFKLHNLKPPNRIYDIIDMLTDPVNSKVSTEIDAKLTALYDLLQINEFVASMCSGGFGDIEQLQNELNEYGKVLALEELSWSIYRMELNRSRLSDFRIYEHMYAQCCDNLMLTYACRQRNYYKLAIKNVLEFSEELNTRIIVIREFLQEC
jgi:hypothetical protein